MPRLFVNNGSSTLASGITDSVLTLTVASSTGDLFPVVDPLDVDNFFMLTLEDVSSNIEVVKATFRASGSDTITIVRAQENTSGLAFIAGDRVECRLTKGILEDFMQKGQGDLLDQGTF